MVNYYLGLDMGTSSVGWAATTPQYELLRAKGKDLWGVRLFKEANSAAERRGYRVSRRRRQREVARMGLLRQLFEEAIFEIDPGFYARMDDSKFHMEERAEDNKQPYALFADIGYTDQDYYEDYPTVFHLRKRLLESAEPCDVRLVYLAIANLYKRRGHFLNDALGDEADNDSLEELYAELQEKAADLGIELPYTVDCTGLEELLGERGISRTKVLENVARFLGIGKKQKAAYQVIKIICGTSAKLVDIFGDDVVDEEHKKLSFSFRDSNYEEKVLEMQDLVADECFELIEIAKAVHDKGLLSSIMKGHTYLSQARVAAYEEHKKDLQQLKKVLKKYDRKGDRKDDKGIYHTMFRTMEAGSYSAYVGSVNSDDKIRRTGGKGSSRDDLYKNIKNILKELPQDDVDVQDILAKIDAEAFLQKQLTFANGVIPNQIHLAELKAILRNAETYLPFLTKKDESGLSVSEKIIEVYKFRIPYYVGPLGQEFKDKKGYNVWAERKEPGKVYPWNFENKIDVTASAEKFISRMVRHCTYLNGENALPKQSLMHEKFQVLNELNNLKVYGEKVSVEVKQDIYRELFGKGKKVTLGRLVSYLEVNGIIKEGDKNAISGIDGGFKNSLTTIGKFYGVFGEAVNEESKKPIMEDIVFWGAVYGNDKKLIRAKIEEKYPDVFDEKTLRRVLGFKFEGWARLSKSFLELEGGSKEDGEIRSIMGALWESNDNHMELLSDRYTYLETLKAKTETAEKALSEWQIEDLNDLYLSAPVKRMVWQTIMIIKELEEVIGNPPSRVFVEMTRSEGEKNTRTKSRKQKLMELYKSIGKEANEWRAELEKRDEAEFRIKKLYLYYLQMGRCMYSGKEIDLDRLMMANSDYDIDHIYPRHFIKDDSLENNLVLVDKRYNAHKSDTFPIEGPVREAQGAWWKYLRDKGFISEEKYNRLTRRTDFTEEEKAAFISRQIVETAQGTKAVTQILERAFPRAEIVFSKASVVSDFRKKFDLLKVRSVNNYHHAHDAYLNIVVGNTYYVKFTRNPLNFVRDGAKYPDKPEYKYHMDKIFDWNVIRNGEVAWISEKSAGEGAKTITTVKKTIAKNSPLVTRYCAEKHGGITGKATIWNKDVAKGKGYIPVKMNDPRLQDVTKYGGFTSVSVSGYSLVEYKMGEEVIRSLEAIPVYLGLVKDITDEVLLEYMKDAIQMESKKSISDVRICRKFIPSDSLIKYNGFYYYLGGKSDEKIIIKNAVEMKYDGEYMNYIKKLEKAASTDYYEEKQKDGEMIISKENNCKFYKYIQEKYRNTIWKFRRGTVGTILNNGEECFKNLTIKQQCYVLLQLVNYSGSAEMADTDLINGSKQSGRVGIDKRISKAKEVLLITQSPTGIYRAEIDLLKV